MKKKRVLSCLLAAALVGGSFSPGMFRGMEVQAQDGEETVIDVTDFGADPAGAKDSAQAIIEALDEAEKIQEKDPDEKIRIEFPKGEYQIYPDKAEERELYVSNTVGADTTYKDKKIGILVEDLDNVTIDGNGSDFVFHGKMTTFASIDSENVTFEDFSVDFAVPTAVDITVESVEGNTATVYIPECYNYSVENNSIRWYSDKSPYTDQYYWTGTDKFPNNYPQSIDLENGTTSRSNDLFNNKTSIEDLGNHRVKFTYSSRPGSVKPGMCYQMRPTVRDTPGTFFWKSKDIVMNNLDVRFLHGFGMVGQTSENITLNDVDFKAPENTGRTTASYADFVQMSGCKGLIDIQDCYFANAHDDPINIHGTFQQVVDISEDRRAITVRYKHNETAGFPSFAAGDEVEFTRQSNMLPVENSVRTVEKVVSGPTGDSSDGVSLTDTVIRFTEPIPEEVTAGEYVAENITYTPEVHIQGNLFRQIPTRGILVTTRKPVVIEDNVFEGMGMAAIYISCDAQSWYESGRVEDVLIQNNTFYRCGGNGVIFIEPTNPTVSTDSTVHKNIRILDNTFYQSGNRTVDAKSVDGLTISGNKIYRFNPDVDIALTAEEDTLLVGQTAKLDVQASADTLGSDIYGFNGCKNVVIENNSYDNGLKMNASISNMTSSDIQIAQSDDVLVGNGQMTAAVGDIHYESSNPSVAEVSYDGIVTAVSEGTADITAYSVMNGRKYVSNVQRVTVEGTGETVYPSDITLESDGDVLDGIGGTMQFRASVSPENVTDSSVTYRVVDAKTGETTDAAVISQDGLLTAKSAGAVEVRAEASNGMTARKIIVIKEEGIVLSDAFEILKPVDGKWKLNEEDESLSIWPTGASEWATGNGATNIFLTDVPDAKTQSIVVKMEGKTKNGYEEGGIVFYKDSDNYTAIQRKHAGGNPNINVSTETGGSPSETGVSDVSGETIYLKLEKTGTTINGYYSVDGQEWTLVRTVENEGLGEDYKAGILCTCGSGVTEIKFADFAVNGEKVSFAQKAVLPEVSSVETVYDAKSNVLTAEYETSAENTDYDVVRWMMADEVDGTYELVSGMEGNDVEVPYELSGKYFKAVVIPGLSNGSFGEPVLADKAVKTETTQAQDKKSANARLEKVTADLDFGTFDKTDYYYLANATETKAFNMEFVPEEGADVLVTKNGVALDKQADNRYEISLDAGINALEVFVTAEDGVTQSVYRFIVLRNTVSDIQVDNIQINGKALEGFEQSVHEYTYFAESADVEKVDVLVESNGITAIGANGQRMEGDQAEIKLTQSNTDISIAVHAADGALTEYYVIHVQKPDDTNADLEGLEIGKFVSLDTDFSSEITAYVGKVFAKDVPFTLTAAEEGANIRLNVGGENIASGIHKVTGVVPFYKGENVVEAVVTSADGQNEKVYTFVLEAPESFYLSDIAYNTEKSYCGNASENQIQYDKSTGNKVNNVVTPADITLLEDNGTIRTFERGIGSHATSDIYFDIEGMAVDTFSTYFGIDQEAAGKNESSAKFAFYKDGEEIIYDGQHEEMFENTPMKEISFSVKDAKELRLYADAGANEWSDHISYGDAKFTTTFEQRPEVPAEELSTDVLEYAISLAKGADTEGVVTSVLTKFETALKNAEDVLAKAKAGDPSVTQKIIDESWQDLIRTMQYLSFKQGDKEDLSKVIAMAEGLDLDLYLKEGQDVFENALKAANTVLEDGDAMQTEVDEAWRALLKAMSELRLKPDKSALETLIALAEKVDITNASDADAEMFRTVLADARLVYEDEEATKEEVDKAADNLKAAISQVASSTTSGNAGKTQNTSADNTDMKTTAENRNTKVSAEKSAKTGDAANLSALFALSVMSAAVIAVRKRKMK